MDLEELAKFLVKAKCAAYAGEGKELYPERPRFKELEYSEGLWSYRDSYSGFFMAPGQEYVRYKGSPVWAMAYSGGMTKEHRSDIDFARMTFSFLKQALLHISPSRPFRGPEFFHESVWDYRDSSQGDITNFMGSEMILFRDEKVFEQNYIGGLIITK